MRRSDVPNEQLQAALNSRVIIEQAKGKLAERLGLDMDQAFNLLRDQARARNRRLSDLARAFVNGSDSLMGVTADKPQRRLPGAAEVHHQPRPGPGSRPRDDGFPGVLTRYLHRLIPARARGHSVRGAPEHQYERRAPGVGR
jgi:hypothetical protein